MRTKRGGTRRGAGRRAVRVLLRDGMRIAVERKGEILPGVVRVTSTHILYLHLQDDTTIGLITEIDKRGVTDYGYPLPIKVQ